VKLTTRQVGDVTVVDAVGRITLGDGASAFRDTVRDLSAGGKKKLLLNLAEVSYIDSSGIGEMVRVHCGVESGRPSEASNLTKRVKDLLRSTKTPVLGCLTMIPSHGFSWFWGCKPWGDLESGRSLGGGSHGEKR
jgi:anti-sigma B factor antagonist